VLNELIQAIFQSSKVNMTAVGLMDESVDFTHGAAVVVGGATVAQYEL
jgi:hypothetical protein